MRIPFIDLKRSHEPLRAEIERALTGVLESGWYILGERCKRFEHDFAAACGTAHAAGMASGTDAIELALRALDIGPGDEVVTQANTCIPTVSAILRAGATPVLCDAEPEAATMDPASLARAIGPRARAIVPVHLYGQCCDMDAILAVAAERGLPVVEDCAQAHGALLGTRHAGTMGVMGCFSFYPTKNLGALGDAGAVVTADPALDARLRELRHYGERERYEHVRTGVNSRLDELQAAVLCCKLPHLERWSRRRAQIARAYEEALRGTTAEPLQVLPDRRHVFHLYVVRPPERDAFRAAMDDRGVATAVHYPRPVHGHEAYRSLVRMPVPLPAAERLAASVVSLPLYPELSDGEVAEVAAAAAWSAAAAAY
jgi:dTDP-4-amino-4,6-dideoxygalactose transaminase